MVGQRTAGGNSAFRNVNNYYAHIANPNERRRLALAEIDKAPFGWYHIRAVIVAGIGFFTDAYAIFAINVVSPFLGIAFWQSNNGVVPKDADTAIKVANAVGTAIGQVGFGVLADILGRKRMYGLELLIIIFTTLAQSISAPSPAISITGLLIFWRFIMGLGIGGDYPLSAVITSEFAPTRWRGAMMGAVFALQGIGQFGASLVALIVTAGFKESFRQAKDAGSCDGDCLLAADKAWRVILGFGAVPGCIALYYRLTIPETPRYTFDVARDVEKARADVKAYIQGRPEGRVDEMQRLQAIAEHGNALQTPKASWQDFRHYFSQWRNLRILLGTAGSWFFLDVAFFGLGLNNSIILTAIGHSGGGDMYDVLYDNAVGNLILICAGAIPGYWVTVALVDWWGRKPIQLMGFLVLTILFCIIGFAFHRLEPRALFALYILSQFFFNFGPNATTFIVPGESFPTRYRSTGHGLSAGAGKIGAILAQVVFGPLQTRGARPGATGRDATPFMNRIMQIFALIMFLGFLTTFLIPETKRKTLEVLSGENMMLAEQDPNKETSVEDGRESPLRVGTPGDMRQPYQNHDIRPYESVPMRSKNPSPEWSEMQPVHSPGRAPAYPPQDSSRPYGYI